MKTYVFYIWKLTRINYFGVPPCHTTLPHSGTFCMGNGYNMDIGQSRNNNDTTVSEIFSVQAICHLLTVMSFIIVRKLNTWVYHSLLDAIYLYRCRVCRRLGTLPLYLYYELLVQVLPIVGNVWGIFWGHISLVYSWIKVLFILMIPEFDI